MKKKKLSYRYVLATTLLVICMVLFASCTSKDKPSKEENQGTNTGEETNEENENPVNDSKLKMERINIYTIDEETLETSSVTAMVDTTDGLTVKTVVDAVVLALEDVLVEVKIGEIKQENGKVTVDILAENSQSPFGNEGSTAEATILDCISYSIFDNFKECEEIYFTVNGAAYESGHISLALDEPYLKVESKE